MASIAEFYDSLPSPGTVHGYRWGINKFERHLGFEVGSWLDAASQVELEQALTAFYLEEVKAMKPMSRMLIMASLRQLLRWFKKDPEIIKQLTGRRPGYHPLTMDAVPPDDLLGRMFRLWNPTFQAYFACLGSSGARGRELLGALKMDLLLDENPAQIILRDTKGGRPRFTFINEQAKQLLEEHLRGTPSTTRLFDFTIWDADHKWSWALKRLKADARDPVTGRLIYHPHCMRKRYRTKLGSLIDKDKLEQLMGHEGYLDESYRRYTAEELGPEYLPHQALLNFPS